MKKHFKMLLVAAATVTMLTLTIIGATNTASYKAENGFQVETASGFYKVTVNESQYELPRDFNPIIRSPLIFKWW